MILSKSNEQFNYNGEKYYIGQRIIGTDQSEYEGLLGTILEIRDGEDKDTENETPDIYCSFDAPEMPHEVEKLEKTFSDLYDEPKKLEDICLDEVIMAPEMVESLERDCPKIKVYVLVEDFAHKGESGFTFSVHSSLKEAQKQMRILVANEADGGLVSDLRDRDDRVEDSNEHSYKIYADGFYCEEHYAVEIKEEQMQVSFSFLKILSL